MDSTTPSPALGSSARPDGRWTTVGLALIAIRFVQGFIYWGGGSRRLIYAQQKLNPHAPTWMANKFQSAMPGAVLGTDRIIAFLLHHFDLLYASIVLFSVAEFVFGLMLMAGLLSRLSATVTIGFSVLLMLMFGWQGATCIDEWTMAVASFAMGATLLLAGGGDFTLDNVLLARRPALADAAWFRWLGGALPLPIGAAATRRFGTALAVATVAFTVGFYHYYRGSVVTPFHGGPVSAAKHHVSLSKGQLTADGAVTLHAYLDGGTPAVPAHVMTVALHDSTGKLIERWDTPALATLPAGAIRNDFAYQKFSAGRFGLAAGVGAEAEIALPPMRPGLALTPGRYRLTITTVNGHNFSLALQRPGG